VSVTESRVGEGRVRAYEEATAISRAGPQNSSLAYRGYPVQELCRRRSFEEVAYLLWHGELPTRDQISAQNRIERAQRALDPVIAATIVGQPFTADPVDTVRMVVSQLGTDGAQEPGITPAAIRARTLRLFAVLPSVVALDQRRRQGLGAIAPRDHLSYAANFLYMTFGKVPEPQIVAAFETSLILYAEYTLTTRSTTSAHHSDLYGAVTTGISALKRSPHAKANEAVVEMMNEIVIPDNARPWLEEALAAGREISGFGHRLDRNGDSRVPSMRTALGMIAALRNGRHLLEIYDALAAAMHQATGRLPNLDYPAGPAYHLIGFDTPTFTPILVAASLPGWTAHIAGQFAVNSPGRPVAADDGLTERHLAQEK
jgi:citrate synthase